MAYYTAGELIRELLHFLPTTYSINQSVSWYKRWGRGKNWYAAAEQLLRDLRSNNADAVKVALRRCGVEL